MTQTTSITIEFPHRKEPNGYIKVRGAFLAPEKYFCHIVEIPGIAEAMKLQDQEIDNRTWKAYEILLYGVHAYLCVDTFERAFDYLIPQLDRIYVQFPHAKAIEAFKEAYFKRWIDGMELVRPEVALGLTEKEGDFYAKIFPDMLLTRGSLNRLVPRISKLLMVTSKAARDAYDNIIITDK
jgi:hypothetical protein